MTSCAGVQAIFILLLLSGVGGTQETTSDASPQVDPLSGEVRLWKPGAREAVKVAERVSVTPHHRLGSVGVARIGINSDVIVTLNGVPLGADQGLSVGGTGARLVLKLHRGTASVESGDTEIVLETPHGTVEGKKVYFIVEVTKEGTRALAVDGRLSFTNNLGQLPIEPGEGATSDGKKPPVKEAGSIEKRLAWTSAAEAPANLLQNPGFEEGVRDWAGLATKERSLFSIDPQVARSGKQSLRVELPNVMPGRDTKSVYLLYQDRGKLALKASRALLRFWVRADKFTIDGNPGALDVQVRFPNGKDLLLPNVALVEGKWTCIRSFFTIEPGDSLELWISAVGKNQVLQGTLWFDDVLIALLPQGK
jgi:hypothetical protein